MRGRTTTLKSGHLLYQLKQKMEQNAHLATPSLIGIQRNGRSVDIEYQFIDAPDPHAPLLIFLHEGLGSVSMWRGWPEQACQALGCRGLVYSRYGYGQSTIRQSGEQRSIDYLHQEAHHDLPALLTALGLDTEKPILYGHSDGGSIALLYAAQYPEQVRAIAVAAPHIFVEDITIDGIQAAKSVYESTDLAARLGRHHRDADSVFWSWNDTWLTPWFRHWNIEPVVSQISCPILAIQGVDDEYGTLDQIHGIKQRAPQTQLAIIPDCGHSPHRDQSDAVMSALGQLIQSISTDTQ